MKISNLVYLIFLHSIAIAFPFSCHDAFEFQASSPVTESNLKEKTDQAVVANIVFKSTDGGQSWQDISEGLPGDNLEGNLFVNNRGFFLRTGNYLFYSKPNNNKAPFWEKEIFTEDYNNIAPGKFGICAYDYDPGQFRQKIYGSNEWSPVNENFKLKGIIDVFETAEGTAFIVCDRGHGLLRSIDNGKNWKKVHSGVWKLAESNGVLMGNSNNGIIRSTDDGETWETVLSEGGAGIFIATIEGGFAAITFNTKSDTRRMRTSYDGGKTWQGIDAGLLPSMMISSIIEVGNYFFCGHPNGIYRSGDKGKTWQLILPSIENKVFNLSVSGNVIYAIPIAGGC